MEDKQRQKGEPVEKPTPTTEGGQEGSTGGTTDQPDEEGKPPKEPEPA